MATGKRRTRYDVGVVEHELVTDDSPEAATPLGASTLMDTMHRELEEALQAQLHLVDAAVEARTRDVDARLRAVQAEIDRVRADTRTLQQHPIHGTYDNARSRLNVPG